MRICGNCDFNDGCTYTSLPPKYKCTLTGKFHFGTAPCELDFVPLIRCDNCKHFREFDEDYKRRWRTNWDGMCMYWNAHSTMKDGFCSVAEEKEEKEEEWYDFD